ncbi:hypothetical protein DIPPA_14784 [Diplonema papillatum]|nr:hypothetical protein DIPPA_26757 [Diplonema papillatum]KAJ9450553.1 hypothetical protein DIPPA_14784 [Diplonema papillatum]
MRSLPIGLVVCVLCTASGGRAFDFDKDWASTAFGLLIKLSAEKISEFDGDAPLILRLAVSNANCLFDAMAPYHDTAVGIFSRFERRPAAERTLRNQNIAAFYGSFAGFTVRWPESIPVIRQVLIDVGLDPDSPLKDDLTKPHGIGWGAGLKVGRARLNDGMNAVGDFNGKRERNFEPFADTTGYEPVNTAYTLKDPSRWQPDLQRKGQGLYKIQQFVTPQYGITEPYSYSNPNAWQVPEPVNSKVNTRRNRALYKKQADEVLEASANLTTTQKMLAQYFDNKGGSLGGSTFRKAKFAGVSYPEYVFSDLMNNMAAFDAGIFVWNEKRRWDAVRPFSAIKHIYGDDIVRAWGGPGQGTVDMKASEWKSLLEEADHPEYPSASACFCYAHTQALRLWYGNDVFGLTVTFRAGSSRAEPGITPAEATSVTFPTWTDFAQNCGQSRVWGGFHFQAAVDASANACPRFGEMAFDYVNAHINGSAADRPARGPLKPLPTPSFYTQGEPKGKKPRGSGGRKWGNRRHH